MIRIVEPCNNDYKLNTLHIYRGDFLRMKVRLHTNNTSKLYDV